MKTPWKLHAVLLYFLFDRPPFMFLLYVGVYIFHYARSIMMERQILVFHWPENLIIPSARYIFVAMSYLHWAQVGYETFFTNSVPSLIVVLQQNQEHKPDYFGIKKSVLPPTQLVFTFKGINIILYFVSTIIPCSLFVKSFIPCQFPYSPPRANF